MDPRFQDFLEQLLAASPQLRPEIIDLLHARYAELARGGVTPRGLPYPDPGDPLSEGANAIRALAEAVDGLAPTSIDQEQVTGASASGVTNPGFLARFNSAGLLAVNDPTGDTHVTNRRWVQAAIAAAGGGSSGLQANGPTSAAYNRNAVGSGFFTTWMNSALQFMRNTSSRRYKEDVRTAQGLDDAVDALRSGRVRWRQYHRIGQPEGTVELGLIAEECVDIPHLVTWDQTRDPETHEVVDEEWRPEAVRYETVLPVYLLEIVQRQHAELVQLRVRVDQLEAR